MKSFWQDLPKPFSVLAPLDGVTDVVFRQIVTRIGKPDVLFTEFTAVAGLYSRGRTSVSDRLLFSPNEQPIVAQIWGTSPDQFYKAAKEIKELGFAGIDLNMGCPERSVVKGGACSALIKNSTLAEELIAATKMGAAGLPVSVKTRIGFSQPAIAEWLGFLLKQDLAALTVHLRTVAEMSAVPAHWEMMPEIVSLRNKLAPDTLLIGNGDIRSLDEIAEKAKEYGIEGGMIGRGVFINPWVFNRSVNMEDKTVAERIGLYIAHIDQFKQQWGTEKHFALLKKFAKTYISNFPEASELRVQLMEAKNLDTLREILVTYKNL